VGSALSLAIAKFSKYNCQSIKYPDPDIDRQKFVEYLNDLVRRRKYDLIIPNSDLTVELLARHKDELEAYTHIASPDYSVAGKTLDKWNTYLAAVESNIPAPDTYLPTSDEDLSQISARINFPVVIKPRKASGALGIERAIGAEDLIEKYHLVSKYYSRPIIQKMIPSGGKKFSFSGILDEKLNLRAAFVHEYLRQYPYKGGVGTLAKSVKNKDVVEMGYRLLKHIGWYGIAEVEFMQDPITGKIYLLEINPRFWGMCEVAVRSGMFYPIYLYDIFVNKSKKSFFDYNENQFVRWLLPGDILAYITNPERSKYNADFFRFIEKNLSYYILSLKDPLPTVGMIYIILISLFQKDVLKFVSRKIS
jgi:predicted ATP-grasp superfamily ATP-dependent carboligase